MTALNQDERLDRIQADGFDVSYLTDGGGLRVRCSQCEALVINGVACHETGCPNRASAARKRYGDADEASEDENQDCAEA